MNFQNTCCFIFSWYWLYRNDFVSEHPGYLVASAQVKISKLMNTFSNQSLMLILRNLPVKGERPPCPCRALGVGHWILHAWVMLLASLQSHISTWDLLCCHLDCCWVFPLKVANVSFFPPSPKLTLSTTDLQVPGNIAYGKKTNPASSCMYLVGLCTGGEDCKFVLLWMWRTGHALSVDLVRNAYQTTEKVLVHHKEF